MPKTSIRQLIQTEKPLLTPLAHDALSEITGAFSSDDLLGEIFGNFCIGK